MSTGFDLLIDEIDGRLHAAVTQKQGLFDLYVDPLDMTASWGSLYNGKVVKIDKKLDAAIVDLGGGLQGILPAKHVQLPGIDESVRRTAISELLAPGQMVLVQVKSEGRKNAAGDARKLPRLTMKVYVTGQHLLYSPVLNHVTVSRLIGNDDMLAFTTRLRGGGGWIVQPSAGTAEASAIFDESQRLLMEWQIVRDEQETAADRARVLKGGPNALHRVLSDYGSNYFDHIYAADKKLLDQMTAWCEKFEPGLAKSKRLRLFRPETRGQRLFDIGDVFSTLETLRDGTLHLKDGGSLEFEPTHAALVIDVNQGSADSPVAVNRAAALEVARQLRLRNISGAVIVDFINMPVKTDRSDLLALLEKAVAPDAAETQVHGFTRLGMVEITRKRRSGWLAEKLRGA